MTSPERDETYRDLLLSPLRTSATYLPKMGGGDSVDLDGFTALYGADPLYHWIGFDSPLMFAAHKAAGGMTSLYRQLGIGSERLFRQVLRDELGLSAAQVTWAYEKAEEANGKTHTRTLTLDGRVESADVVDSAARSRVEEWVKERASALGVSVPLKGAVFEVRQGYKSADSKRQNADLANAAQALGHGYLPVLTIMSTQMNRVVRTRYTVGNWAILTGEVGYNDDRKHTFDFVRDVIGYDIVAFFERNQSALRSETETVLKKLLEAD